MESKPEANSKAEIKEGNLNKVSVWKRLDPPRPTQRSDGRKRSTTGRAPEGKEEPKPELIDLASDTTSEDEDRHSPSMLDILDHFDTKNNEVILDPELKDSMTISKKEARKILITNNALDSLIYEEADMS